MLNISKTENDIITLAIEVKDKPMNVITETFLTTMETMIDEITRDDTARGLILTSSRNDFMVGADLEMLTNVSSSENCYQITRRLQTVLRRMETWGKPVVAALNGTALGGGFEIALACHYRVCLEDPKIKLGLPEVKLGLLPGGGGTQKIPRLIGIQNSLPLLTQGKTLNPSKALELGIVDEVAVDNAALIDKAIAFINSNEECKQPWDMKKFSIPGGNIQSPKGYQVIPVATAMLFEKTFGNYPAPLSILKCVYEGLQVDIDKGLEIEARYFTELVMGRESKGMIQTLFYGVNDCLKGKARPEDTEVPEVKKVGIIGAGMMGRGIAYSAASSGLQVILKDISKEAAEKGKAYSENLFDKAISKGRANEEDKKSILSLISTSDTSDNNDLEDCELIIEAVIEDREIKAKITKEVEEVMGETAIFGSNTSTIPITMLAKESSRPKNFIGIHFFSPVEKMPLVEIIKGKDTSNEALATAIDFVKRLKKTPIVVNDGRGFYTSRVFTTYIAEGVNLLSEGVSPHLIERAGKMAGMPVGPLAVADEVSIELMFHIQNQAKIDLGDAAVNKVAFEICEQFVNMGRLGKKVGKGFYEYPPGEKKHISPDLEGFFPLKAEQPSIEEVKQRLLAIQSVETLKCFEENVLTSARDADVGSLFGWGFPAYTGGTIGYVEYRGAEVFLEECQNFSEKFGERFTPPKILKDWASNGTNPFYN